MRHERRSAEYLDCLGNRPLTTLTIHVFENVLNVSANSAVHGDTALDGMIPDAPANALMQHAAPGAVDSGKIVTDDRALHSHRRISSHWQVEPGSDPVLF